MENKKRVKMLRNIGFYIPNSLKFYNLKNEKLTPIVFIIAFIIYSMGLLFLNSVLTNLNLNIDDLTKQFYSQTNDYDKLINTLLDWLKFIGILQLVDFIMNVFLGIVTAVFLLAYVNELKGEAYSLKLGFEKVLKNIFRIFIAGVIFTLGYTIGMYFFIIPGAIFYFVFLFYLCYILDNDKGIIASFKSSMELTRGHRVELFSIVILFSVITFVLKNFVASFVASVFSASGNGLFFTIVPAFMSALVYLMLTKLIALLYVDLEYGWKPLGNDQEKNR